MNWRIIEQAPYSAAMNMAIDHSIYESIANGKQLPTIRFYKWIPSSISLGAYQNAKEINLLACKRNNIGIVRRMTGGRAVFHDKMDFTYSVIAPIKVFNYSIESAYRQICSWIINSLGELGINASLENRNDIMVDGKKISGNAARAMDKGIYLQHGTLIYDIDMEVMLTALNITKDAVNEKVTSILQHKKISQEKLYDALRKNFAKGKEISAGELSKSEAIVADDLSVTKYNHITLPSGTLLKNKGACYIERGDN